MARLPPFAQGGSHLRLTCSLFSNYLLAVAEATLLAVQACQVRGLATDGWINHSYLMQGSTGLAGGYTRAGTLYITLQYSSITIVLNAPLA